IFVYERRSVDRVLLQFFRQRNRTGYFRIVSFGGVNYLFDASVQNFMFVSAHSDAKLLRLFFFFSHNYLIILVTTPAPTVLPHSRMANLCFSSKATGATSLTVNFTVSPGITISTPWAKVTSPVTSVVLI